MPSTSSFSISAEVSVDVCQRELLTQLVALPLVRVQIDRLRKDEGLVQPVELMLNRLRLPLSIRRVVSDFGLTLLPRLQNKLLDQAHVSCRWL